jgi:beta-lactamase class D
MAQMDRKSPQIGEKTQTPGVRCRQGAAAPAGRGLHRLAILLMLLAAVTGVRAADPDIARVFADAGVNGTIVIARLDGGREFVHDEGRALTRFPVASTFKILNSLIALDEGVVAPSGEVFLWNGQQHWLPDWNRNHSLASAYRASCVWCYQELARRIGADRYRLHLRRAGYGPLPADFETTGFWLDGTLQLNAFEQVAFLRQLVQRSLPYKAASYDALEQIMLADGAGAARFYAKTGWSTSVEPPIGWYVGYVETAADTWLFALNIDAPAMSDLPLRRTLTEASLRAKGIID